MAKHSCALERRESFYPSPLFKALIGSASEMLNTTKSKIVIEALKLYFDSMPPEKLERIRSLAKNI